MENVNEKEKLMGSGSTIGQTLSQGEIIYSEIIFFCMYVETLYIKNFEWTPKNVPLNAVSAP